MIYIRHVTFAERPHKIHWKTDTYRALMRLRHKLDDYTEIQSDVLKMAPEVPTIEYEDYFHLRYDIV